MSYRLGDWICTHRIVPLYPIHACRGYALRVVATLRAIAVKVALVTRKLLAAAAITATLRTPPPPMVSNFTSRQRPLRRYAECHCHDHPDSSPQDAYTGGFHGKRLHRRSSLNQPRERREEQRVSTGDDDGSPRMPLSSKQKTSGMTSKRTITANIYSRLPFFMSPTCSRSSTCTYRFLFFFLHPSNLFSCCLPFLCRFQTLY